MSLKDRNASIYFFDVYRQRSITKNIPSIVNTNCIKGIHHPIRYSITVQYGTVHCHIIPIRFDNFTQKFQQTQKRNENKT